MSTAPTRSERVPALGGSTEAAERRHRERLIRMNQVAVPIGRAIGFNLLLVVVVVHNLVILEATDFRQLLWFAALVELYIVASWLVLRRFYDPDARFDISTLFLIADVWVLVGAVWVTGADQSWLYFALLFRVADQIVYGRRWTMFYAHLMPLLYAGLLVYVELVEQRQIAWAAELAKVAFLYLSGLYFAQASGFTDMLRRKTARAMEVARASIRDLQRQSDELVGAREEAEAAAAAAERANQAKSQFLANMSHELRTPLNAIIGYSEMLMEDIDDMEAEEVASDLKKISGAGKHLLGLINNVLDLSKVEAGRMDLYLETVDVEGLVHDVAATVQPIVIEGRDHLEVQLSGRLGSMRTDVTKLKQILLNLLSNGIKFTERGHVTLAVSREVEAGAERIVFRVEDDGIGMTSEQIERLFQPFMQADASTTRKYGGTGLGLAISKRFVEMMGGSIEVSSEPGSGTAFVVRLPATPQEPRSAPALPVEERSEPVAALASPDDPGAR